MGTVSVFNIEDYGASSTASAASNVSAIQSAADAASSAGGTLYGQSGLALPIDATVTILCNTEMTGVTLNYSGSAEAIIVGSSLVQDKTFHLPAVTRTNGGNGWTGGVATSVGVKIQKAYNCRFFVDQIRDFGTGLFFVRGRRRLRLQHSFRHDSD